MLNLVAVYKSGGLECALIVPFYFFRFFGSYSLAVYNHWTGAAQNTSPVMEPAHHFAHHPLPHYHNHTAGVLGIEHQVQEIYVKVHGHKKIKVPEKGRCVSCSYTQNNTNTKGDLCAYRF